jgi:hypothetical protein
MLNPSSEYSNVGRVSSTELHSLTSTVEKKALANTFIIMSESSGSPISESVSSTTTPDTFNLSLTFSSTTDTLKTNSSHLPMHKVIAKEPEEQFHMRSPELDMSFRTRIKRRTEFNRVDFLRMRHIKHHLRQ